MPLAPGAAPPTRRTPDRSPDNRSLVRGIELLRAFRPGSEALGNGELAERSGLSRATVSRLTQTLLRSGFLEYDARRRVYRLGAPVLSLAQARRSGSQVLQSASAPMRALSESARINVGLALADRDEMIYLEAIRANRRPSQRSIVAGQRVPIELTSLGRAWLAVSPAARAPLYALFAKRRSNWPMLEGEIDAGIDDVLERGWCWAAWQPEVVAVATPLLLPYQPVHVLNVSTSSKADAATVAVQLSSLLMDLAQRIRGAFEAAR